MKINSRIFRFVEFELYNYDTTKAEIEAIRSDIFEKIPAVAADKDYVTGGELSNPTEAKGMRLTTNVALLRMQQTVDGIDRALQVLHEEHYILFEMKYRQKKEWQEIVIQMPTSERSYSRKRKELVEMCALQLGYISEVE